MKDNYSSILTYMNTDFSYLLFVTGVERIGTYPKGKVNILSVGPDASRHSAACGTTADALTGRCHRRVGHPAYSFCYLI